MSYTSIDPPTALEPGGSAWTHYCNFLALLKPRVMSLVVFTGFVGLFLAPGELHPVLQATAILCIALGAGASGAINMWFDRDIDEVMSRTKDRPIPSGRVSPEAALTFGVLLAGGSIMIMGLAINWLSSFLLAFTIGFYIFIYTVWLKRRTPQNIVIGGAAGAVPPMIGCASVSGTVTLDSLILFCIIFVWTPPHFWALSLYRSDDYKAAKIPMLPLTHGRPATCRQIMIYSCILSLTGILPCFLGGAGVIYGVLAAVLGIFFLIFAWRVFENDCDKNSKQLFGFSILYLFLLFSGFLIDKMIEIPFSFLFI